jgi:hypothetical protein
MTLGMVDPFARFAQVLEFNWTESNPIWYVESSDRYIYNALAFQFDMASSEEKSYVWKFDIIDTIGYVYHKEVKSSDIFGRIKFSDSLTRTAYVDLSEIYG